MKIFLKDTVYRNAYFLIAAAWLFTLSFIFSNYWSYTSSPQGVRKTLEQHLRQREQDLDELLQDTALLKRLVQTAESQAEARDMVDKPYGFFLYSLEESGPIVLRYWNTQQSAPTDEMLVRPDGDYFVNLPNGQYELVRRKVSIRGGRNLLACALIPVRWDYFVENDYLRNGFVDQPNIEDNYTITPAVTEIPVVNSRGRTLFHLEKKSGNTSGGSDWITILLRVLGSLMVFFYIHMLALGIARRFGPGKAVVFLLSIIVLLRTMSYFFPLPLDFRQFELFSPTIYGSNIILRTLGDLLINALLLVWIVLFGRAMINRYDIRLKESRKLQQWLVAILLLTLLLLITWVSGSVVRSLVSDSSISYEVTNFFKLNLYTMIGFIVLSCVSIGYFTLSHILLRFLEDIMPGQTYFKAAMVTVIGLLFLTLSIRSQQVTFDLGLLVWLVLYIFLVNLPANQGSRRISGSATVFWLVFFSASITIILFSQNRVRELENRKNAAVKLAVQADPSSNIKINIATQTLTNEFLRENQHDKNVEDGDVGLGVRQELRDALDVHQRRRAVDQAHAVGDEQRLRLGQGTTREDQPAVDQSADQADREADEDGGALADLVDHRDGHDGHERDDPPDGQVEEPGHDHEGHPEGGEDQRPGRQDDVVEVVEGQELGFDDRGDEHQPHDRHVDRVVPQEVADRAWDGPAFDGLCRCAHANSKAFAMISSTEATIGSNSPLTRPSQIVLTRLLMWRTSGNSEEIRMIDPPSSTILFINM